MTEILPIIILCVAGVAAHVAMAMASRKINLLFLLAGGFVLLSFVSAANTLEQYSTVAKYARCMSRC